MFPTLIKKASNLNIDESFFTKAHQIATVILQTYPDLLVSEKEFIEILDAVKLLPIFEYHNTESKVTAQVFFMKENHFNTVSLLATVTEDMYALKLEMDALALMLTLVVDVLSTNVGVTFERLHISTELDGFGSITKGLPVRHTSTKRTYH
jgi:hypothetical protein